jgi:signal peptidase II
VRDLQAAGGTPLAAVPSTPAAPAAATAPDAQAQNPAQAPAVPAVPAVPAARRRGAVLACVAAFVLAADAITKAIVVAHLREDQPVHLIGNVLELWLTRNSGAAFSVGTGQTVVFTLIAIGVIIAIVRTARRLYSLGWAIALGLLLGGAAGNLADRIFRAPGLFRGDVVDWIGVTPRYYPIFNLADSAIVCGGILTVILAMRGYHLDGSRTVPAGPGDADPGDASPADASPGDASPADASRGHDGTDHGVAGEESGAPRIPADGRGGEP